MTIPETIREQLELERRELEVTIDEASKRLRQIKHILASSGASQPNWQTHVFNSLELYNMPLSTAEILNHAFLNNPNELLNLHVRREYIKHLSVVINRLCKAGKIVGLSEDKLKGKIYCLPEWVGEDGGIKPELQAQYQFMLERNKIMKNRFMT